MLRRSSALRIGLLLAALALPAVMSGCGREARHQVLTFLFDGVPPLDGSPDEAGPATEVDPLLAKRDEILAARAAAAAAREYSGPFSHGPYAARQCEECHVMAAGGFGFGSSSGGEGKSIVPGQFVLPPDQLCVACHDGRSAEAVYAAGLRLHGPTTNCTSCHHPHSSPQRYMLRIAATELCRQCHGTGFIHDADLHAGVGDCLECHNPHLGRDASMLRDEYQETF